jgi:hypothetical protein
MQSHNGPQCTVGPKDHAITASIPAISLPQAPRCAARNGCPRHSAGEQQLGPTWLLPYACSGTACQAQLALHTAQSMSLWAGRTSPLLVRSFTDAMPAYLGPICSRESAQTNKHVSGGSMGPCGPLPSIYSSWITLGHINIGQARGTELRSCSRHMRNSESKALLGTLLKHGEALVRLLQLFTCALRHSR